MRIFDYHGTSYSAQELLDYLRNPPSALQDWEQDIADFLADWLSDSASVAVWTSGSTGLPKQLNLRKADMRRSAAASVRYFGLEAGAGMLLAMPVRYIAGKMMLVRALTAGSRLAIRQPVADPFAGLQEEYCFTAVTPHQMKQSLLAGSCTDRIATILIGGEPIQPDLLQSILPLKSKCYASFGMTETITHFAVQSLNQPYEEFFECLPDVKIATSDENHLIIHAPWMQEAVQTTDIIQLISPNRFRWLGRADFVINSGGIKLHPELIERKLQNFIHKKFIISQIPDHTFGEVPVLVIESRPEDFPYKLEEINTKLDKFEKLKSLFFVDTLETTDTGKVNRPAIKKQLIQ